MTTLLRELLHHFWHASYEEQAPPALADELSMEVSAEDDTVVEVCGEGWRERGTLVAAHALLDRIWDRLGWPNLCDYYRSAS